MLVHLGLFFKHIFDIMQVGVGTNLAGTFTGIYNVMNKIGEYITTGYYCGWEYADKALESWFN